MTREPTTPLTIGRYALYDEIASGGMATVHIGRLLGPVGFSRTVAIKRMHANLAKDPEFVSMFLDEARLAARVRHPNVIGTLDVVALAGELFLVMEYVHGESLFRLMKAARESKTTIELPIISAIMIGVLDGLHAAHEATNEREEPLGIVHRDVSPHNVIVGANDGLARVLDFGVAKAADRTHSTRDGQIKGKLSYMAPEQLSSGAVDRRSDVYSASVVLWEAITGQRMIPGESELKSMVTKVLSVEADPPSRHTPGIPPELDALVMRGLAKEVDHRVQTAREMARALQRIIPPAPASDVAEWVETIARSAIDDRARRVAIIEQTTSMDVRSSLPPPTSVPPPPKRSSDAPTIVGFSLGEAHGRPYGRYAVIGGAILFSVVASVVVTTAENRARDVHPAAAATSAPALAASMPSDSPPASASAAEPPGPGVVLEPVEVAPAPTPSPAAAAPRTAPPIERRAPVGTPPKKPATGGEFDHVMDSRK